jgi:iron complex transport system substrate-binding protein
MTRTIRAATLFAAIATLAVALMLTGCSTPPASTNETPPASTPAFPVTITDDASRSVTIAERPTRVVSLAPANTEIVTGIGYPVSQIVGVTTYDDYPAAVKQLPKMGDFINPNIEAITAAKPQVILVTGGVQADLLKKLEGTGAKVVVVDPQSLPALYQSIEMVGKVVGREASAKTLVDQMRGSIDAVTAKVSTEPSTTAFIEVGYNPLFAAGTKTFMDDLLRAAGGTNVVSQPGFVAYSTEQLLKGDPAVYLATKGLGADPGTIKSRPGYDKLAAVKNDRIVIVDDSLVTRPGPRVVLGVTELAKALHPKLYGQP